KLVRTLIAWCRGERDVCSMVRVPTREDEDLRRSHRERSRLIGEQTAHLNRRCDRLVLDDLKTGDGRPLPPRLRCEIEREIERLKMVQQQIAPVEKERDCAPTPC